MNYVCEPAAQHKNVLQAIRKVQENLNNNRLNFQPTSYTDTQGRQQPMIQFSEDVLFPVLGGVGGMTSRMPKTDSWSS
jgi:Phage regulatory protein Rha (Phage_pRha)